MAPSCSGSASSTTSPTQKRAEQELRQALELERRSAERLREIDDIKSTFLTAVSHDLQTPLTAILGNALTLRQGDELGLSPSERDEVLDSLVKRTRRLTSLVTDLLDVDRLSRGIVEPRRSTADVGALAADLVRELDLPEGRAVRVLTEPAVAAVDTSMVARIIENLLANAAKHTPIGSVIWVRTWEEDDGIILAVEDDGPGVDEEIALSIFKPFERGPSPNPQSPGVGIGLSLVARFADLHGGRAWVQEREGGGASFRVWLPADAPSSPNP